MIMRIWKQTGKIPKTLKPRPFKHIGIYGYKAGFLMALTRLPVSDIERSEKLEQLRALSWGFKIMVPTTPHDSIGVDVPEDIEKVVRIIESEGK